MYRATPIVVTLMIIHTAIHCVDSIIRALIFINSPCSSGVGGPPLFAIVIPMICIFIALGRLIRNPWRKAMMAVIPPSVNENA